MSLLSVPAKGIDLDATLHCIKMSTGIKECGTFATQVKRYTCILVASKVFLTFGKQTTNHVHVAK